MGQEGKGTGIMVLGAAYAIQQPMLAEEFMNLLKFTELVFLNNLSCGCLCGGGQGL